MSWGTLRPPPPPFPTSFLLLYKRYPQILGTRVDSSSGVRALHSFCILCVLFFLFLLVAFISCSWSLIRRCVLSWQSTDLAPHLRKFAWQTAQCQSGSVSYLSSVYTCHVPVFNPILVVPVTVSKDQSSRRFSFWTRTLFIWLTTYFGTWDSKRRLRPTRLYSLYALWLFYQWYHLNTLWLLYHVLHLSHLSHLY